MMVATASITKNTADIRILGIIISCSAEVEHDQQFRQRKIPEFQH